MRPLARVGLVLAGFAAAIVAASLALQVYVASTPAVDRTGGMSAFGDSLYFLGALGIAAIPAAGLALYYLRPYPAFWRTLSALSLVVMLVTLAAAAASIWNRSSSSLLVSLSPLWLLATPLFAGAFLLSAVFAPTRSARIALICACAVQAAAFAFVILSWVQSAAG